MDQIVKELHEAAGEGNVASLLNLLEKDRFMLDRSMVISYGETPLHIAAMLGHLEFCKELLRRKPELAEELDLRRSSALHLASAKGFTEIVKLLVSTSPKMGFAFDEDGKIPIHVAAMKGRVEVLKELVDVQPDAALQEWRWAMGETVLHLCVQYSQLEALRFLVEHLNDEELVNVKDDNGNSILHLAVFDKQVQHYKSSKSASRRSSPCETWSLRRKLADILKFQTPRDSKDM
ncbi:hypothetical protein Leryth_001535 [Lithospermum erythrorhizon]|nr:hypothetical protein Leryth_001535 [Lithospermum erythrorhizon]